MRIILDIDDVLADLVTKWISVYNYGYRDNLRRENITDWDIGSFTKIGKKFYDYLDMPDLNLYSGMKVVEDALEGVEFLRSLNYEIVFCTVFDYYNRKWNWLKENKFTDNLDEYVVAHNKNLIKGDIIIDDNWDNFINFDGDKLLYRQPWNKKFHTIYEVNNWKDIMQKFQLLNMIEENS